MERVCRPLGTLYQVTKPCTLLRTHYEGGFFHGDSRNSIVIYITYKMWDDGCVTGSGVDVRR